MRLCLALVGAEEVRLSVVHEQTSKQKAQTLHCQPPGTRSFDILGEWDANLFE